jgi:hypothetical protein
MVSDSELSTEICTLIKLFTKNVILKIRRNILDFLGNAMTCCNFNREQVLNVLATTEMCFLSFSARNVSFIQIILMFLHFFLTIVPLSSLFPSTLFLAANKVAPCKHFALWPSWQLVYGFDLLGNGFTVI